MGQDSEQCPRAPDGWRGQRGRCGRRSGARRELSGEEASFAQAPLINGALISLIIISIVVIAITVMSPHAFGRDLGQWGDADPDLRQWYERLKRPDFPASSCCGEADAYFCDDYRLHAGKAVCTITDDRPDAPRGRPHIDIGTVFEIPEAKLKWDRGNPTGHGVIFLNQSRYVFCYVQPEGA